MNDNLVKIILAIIGLFIGATFIFKVTIGCRNKNNVRQDNNTVGGDQAGRDINK